VLKDTEVQGAAVHGGLWILGRTASDNRGFATSERIWMK